MGRRTQTTRMWCMRTPPTRTAAAAALAVVALVVTAIPALAADDVAVRELTVAYSDTDVALDPLHAFTATEAQLFTALSEGLVSYHPATLDPVPGVAHTWHVSDDGLRYRFLLRDNARFSDGTRVVAEDFRASWLRIINPGEQAEYSLMFDVIRGVADYRSGTNTNESAVGIRAISEGELEVVLERPGRALPEHAGAPRLRPRLPGLPRAGRVGAAGADHRQRSFFGDRMAKRGTGVRAQSALLGTVDGRAGSNPHPVPRRRGRNRHGVHGGNDSLGQLLPVHRAARALHRRQPAVRHHLLRVQVERSAVR